MKTVYFIQHGIAESKDVDPHRPLSALGRHEAHKVAVYLQEHKIVLRKIYHSGKLRAQQTAKIFAEILGTEDVSALNCMNPNDNPDLLIAQIAEDAVMYVGHLPNIGNVVANIVSNSVINTIIKFQNSAVVCIEIEESSASIKWFITPDIC